MDKSQNKQYEFPKTKQRFWTIIAFLPLAIITFPIGLGVWLSLLWWSFNEECKEIQAKEERVPLLKRPEIVEANKWENLSDSDKRTKMTSPFYIKYPAGWNGIPYENGTHTPLWLYEQYGGVAPEGVTGAIRPEKFCEMYKAGKVTWVDVNDPVVVERAEKWMEIWGKHIA